MNTLPKPEPLLLSCNLRMSADDYEHIECRFSDGQKGAMILVDKEFPQLAEDIVNMLNVHAALRRGEKV